LTAIYRSSGGNLDYICGGSLVSTVYTLTVSFQFGFQKISLNFQFSPYSGSALHPGLLDILTVHMHPTLQFILQNKRQSSALRAEDVLLFFGKHKLVIWNEDGVEKRGVSYFKVHPQWDPFAPAFDADLALIRMEAPVTYSAYIRPVCLWNFQADLNSVVGQMGNVVGWGE
jgi:Trypsin